MRRWWIFCAAIGALGCDGAADCASDADCASGTHCALGACIAECEADGDCGGATCDVARGRCEGEPTPDAGPVEVCERNADCDDGVFCNGAESCVPGATASGCVSGGARCAVTERCDEEAMRCEPASCDEPDADGDGHASERCGGDDCDDDDVVSFPGANDVCNLVDEDCSLETLGSNGDVDGDGYTSRACCNPTEAGMRCGDDCDDARADVHPGVTDACGNGDEDCDGAVDEDPTVMVYPDVDGDGFGVAEGATLACAATSGYALNADDCDDTRANVHPGAFEACNGRDDDCNGDDDDTELGCHCVDGEQQPCGATDVGDCELGIQTCLSGRWGACAGEVTVRTEACGGGDEDCDGETDEDGAVGGTIYFRDFDEDGYGTLLEIRVACTTDPGWATRAGDCNDNLSSVHPSPMDALIEPACPVLHDAVYGPYCDGADCWWCDYFRGGRPVGPEDWDADCDGRVSSRRPYPTTLNCDERSCFGIIDPPLYPIDLHDWTDCGRPVPHEWCDMVNGSCSRVVADVILSCR